MRQVFASLLEDIKLRPSKRLLYQYLLVCCQQSMVQNKALKAIATLHKITDTPTKEFHTASYAISLHIRAMMAKNFTNILSVATQSQIDKFIDAKMLQTLDSNIPQKKIEYFYNRAIIQ